MSTTLNRALSILVADDRAIVREGLRHVLESVAPQWKVTEADSDFTAVEQMVGGGVHVSAALVRYGLERGLSDDDAKPVTGA